MLKYNYFRNNNLPINKIEIKGKIIIITSNDKKYVLKKNNGNSNNNSLFTYLNSRSFNYFPKIYMIDNNYVISEYLEEIPEPNEQKLQDLIYIVSLLHSKTSFYKDISEDEYKKLYEKIKSNIDEIYKYYNDYIEEVETNIYMSPSQYLFASNYYKIIDSLNNCYQNLEKWMRIINKKKKWRICTIHNNLELSHFIKNTDSYLINWDNATKDFPVLDLYILYKKYAQDYDFLSLFKIYEKIYPLLSEEKIFFCILILLPDKIEICSNEMQNCINIGKLINYLDKTNYLLPEYAFEKTKENDNYKNKNQK